MGDLHLYQFTSYKRIDANRVASDDVAVRRNVQVDPGPTHAATATKREERMGWRGVRRRKRN